MTQVALQPVDRVEVTVVVDNAIDILAASNGAARRWPLPSALIGDDIQHLRAEHGYALLVTTHRAGASSSLLYDAGLGRDTLLYNLDVLEAPASDLRAIVLSHGHADHHGGLEGIVRRVGRLGLPLVLHPDAWMKRRVVFPSGVELAMPPPSRSWLEGEGVDIVEERGPTLLLDGTVVVSGQTERVTSFEKGFPLQQVTAGDGWEPDPWIWDDQSVSILVEGKGLVILSSCSHSGHQRHEARSTGHRAAQGPRLHRRFPPHRRAVRTNHSCHR